jgi:rod shape determining protein RodA
MFERRLYHHMDWAMVGAILALCLIGLAQIYSATYTPTGASRIFYTQIWALLLGFIGLMLTLSVDYRTLADKSHFLYIAIVAMLVGVLVFGVVRGGSRRWIDLGPMNLQPS